MKTKHLDFHFQPKEQGLEQGLMQKDVDKGKKILQSMVS